MKVVLKIQIRIIQLFLVGFNFVLSVQNESRLETMDRLLTEEKTWLEISEHITNSMLESKAELRECLDLFCEKNETIKQLNINDLIQTVARLSVQSSAHNKDHLLTTLIIIHPLGYGIRFNHLHKKFEPYIFKQLICKKMEQKNEIICLSNTFNKYRLNIKQKKPILKKSLLYFSNSLEQNKIFLDLKAKHLIKTNGNTPQLIEYLHKNILKTIDFFCSTEQKEHLINFINSIFLVWGNFTDEQKEQYLQSIKKNLNDIQNEFKNLIKYLTNIIKSYLLDNKDFCDENFITNHILFTVVTFLQKNNHCHWQNLLDILISCGFIDFYNAHKVTGLFIVLVDIEILSLQLIETLSDKPITQ